MLSWNRAISTLTLAACLVAGLCGNVVHAICVRPATVAFVAEPGRCCEDERAPLPGPHNPVAGTVDPAHCTSCMDVILPTFHANLVTAEPICLSLPDLSSAAFTWLFQPVTATLICDTAGPAPPDSSRPAVLRC